MSVEGEFPPSGQAPRRHLWPIPPEGGYTVEDLYRLPDLPAHTELIDGSLVFMSPQSLFHAMTVDALNIRLRELAPAEYWVSREMTTVLDEQNAPEPDLLVVHADSVQGLDQTRFEPSDVVLAVEVVSPSSRSRDRDTKPLKYARAGIPHYWRVEKENDRPVVHVFELEPSTGAYVATGIFREELKVSVPFPVAVDLTDIATPPRRS
ncbi:MULTISPECIES: Uma2 family endonuclease [Streptomyces]|uniref:Uma2 family endonuclease n=1 Tax=Streptomyces TaxID=1883 RepID=UPI0004C61811|nr:MULTISPECIES: Uma2 family endonuclease [Streptomyces]QHF97613.1 Uma2 family endonuclease [Streptomyces sp. NHF165]